jgi:single-stranded-DNA-specific exonuclease
LRRRGDFKEKNEPDLKKYLDLVALGTIADMVPLIGQNRILAKSGIRMMKDSAWPGIVAMMNGSGINPFELTSGDVAYRLAPRLNAPGRMGEPLLGLDILMERDLARANSLFEKINAMNDRRQSTEGQILDLIEKKYMPNIDISTKRTIVIWNKGWHKGVLGIVASRILDRFHRPSLILTIQDNLAVGSGRSIDGFNLHKALSRLEHLLERFGGHYHAAGLTLHPDNIERFERELEEIALLEIHDDDLLPFIEVDAEVSLEDMKHETVKRINDLSPFGKGNPEPVFCTRQLRVISSRIVGERHLKLRISDEKKTMDAIGFNLAEIHPLEDKNIDIAFTPEINKWQGFERVQLRIVDLKCC